MEPWVRSQDKNRFAQAHNFSYDYDVNKHIVNCNGYPYGVYNSKERCLEIIDEIQNLFCDFLVFQNVQYSDQLKFRELGCKGIQYFSNGNEPKVEFHKRSSIVYEMPEV